jgi:hypothetical protein
VICPSSSAETPSAFPCCPAKARRATKVTGTPGAGAMPESRWSRPCRYARPSARRGRRAGRRWHDLVHVARAGARHSPVGAHAQEHRARRRDCHELGTEIAHGAQRALVRAQLQVAERTPAPRENVTIAGPRARRLESVTALPWASGSEKSGALDPAWTERSAIPESASFRSSAPRVANTSGGTCFAAPAVNAAGLRGSGQRSRPGCS